MSGQAVAQSPGGCGCLLVACSGLCILPRTLHLTDSLLGVTGTLAYSGTGTGGQWIGTAPYAFPGFGGCPAKNVTLRYQMSQSDCGVTLFCPAIGDCPDPAGIVVPVCSFSFPTVVCTPFSSTSRGSFLPAALARNLYQGLITNFTAPVITVTP